MAPYEVCIVCGITCAAIHRLCDKVNKALRLLLLFGAIGTESGIIIEIRETF